MCTHDKENHKRCDKGTAQKQYVTREGVTREGVISAFHFSETRVFDLISHLIMNKDCEANKDDKMDCDDDFNGGLDCKNKRLKKC